jgi:hypothetical protein
MWVKNGSGTLLDCLKVVCGAGRVLAKRIRGKFLKEYRRPRGKD